MPPTRKTTPPANLLAEAIRCHQGGDLERAAILYRRFLKTDLDHVDANNLLGLVHLQTGQFDKAAKRIAHALDKAPDSDQAHYNHGLALTELGRLDQAERAFRRVVELNPENADGHDAIGNIVRRLGRHGEAIEWYDRAVALRPDRASYHFNLAETHKHQGDLRKALAAYWAALVREPKFPAALIGIGDALTRNGQPDEAIAYLERAVKLAPEYADAHNAFGVAANALGRVDEAIAAFEQATTLAPMHADAQINCGLTLEQVGRLNAAAAAFQNAIAARPSFADAHYHLAHLAGRDSTDAEIEAMRRLFEADRTSVGDRVLLAFGLGTACERLGRDAEAFDWFEAAHALKKLRVPFDADDHERFVELLTATFLARPGLAGPDANAASGVTAECGDPKESPERGTPATSDPALRENPPTEPHRTRAPAVVAHGVAPAERADLPRPILVIGMPRSGTTLTEQILASHPQVHGGGERDLAARMANEIAALTGKPYPLGFEGLGEKLLHRLGQQYLEGLGDGVTTPFVTDTTPMNFLHVGLLAAALPGARFVHCRRDAMDTCLSIFMHPLTDAHAYAHDLETLGRYYRLYRRLMRHWETLLPDRLHELRYESLVEKGEAEIRRLLTFCGLPFDAACVAFHRTDRVVRSPSAGQVRQPIYGSSIGRWRRFEHQLAPLRHALGNAVPPAD